MESRTVDDEREAAVTAHEFAGCMVLERGSAARDLLNARDSDELKKIDSKLGGQLDCIANLDRNALVEGIRVSYPPDVMRGHLSEELLKRDRAAVSRLQPLPIQKTYARSWFAFTGRHVSLDEMSACVADTNPAAIMALVGKQPFSGDENAAFGALMPSMGPCLVAGTKLDAKREPLRASLAEALYQRLEHPEESVVAPAAK